MSLFPSFLGPTVGAGFRNHLNSDSSRERRRIFSSCLRLATPVADALAWYENAARGLVTIPRSGNPIELIAPPFGVEPALGRFCVGETVPFAPRWHDAPRINRLVPMEDPDQASMPSATTRRAAGAGI